MSIATRLRLFFAAMVVLMLLGSILSFWQFTDVNAYASPLSRVEQKMSATLRLNNSMLILMSQLHRAADLRDAEHFEKQAHRLLDEFQRQSAQITPVLYDMSELDERKPVLIVSIRQMLESAPERISSLVELARSEDWVPLHARLLNQADETDQVLAALMQQADSDLALARRRLIEDLERARRRSFTVLAATGTLSLAAAIALGAVVTRSITRPLTALSKGARALAGGDFHHRVAVEGRDELALVSEAFNRTGEELSRLFEEMRREHAAAEAAQQAQREHARELARANADLEQFAYSASHDLREPLRIVALYSQLLQRKYAGQLDQRADEYIGHLHRAARQVEQLITDLLTYTRIGSVKDTDAFTDVGVTLERVLSTLEMQIRDHQCTVTAQPLPAVRAHEVHVQQVLQNLIGNAIKYRSKAPPEIQIWAERRDGQWAFAVRDNGLGIEPQYAKQIFGMFKRLHGQDYPGTGIGLAICHRIVESYDGAIWVESEPSRGATFWFTLPAA